MRFVRYSEEYQNWGLPLIEALQEVASPVGSATASISEDRLENMRTKAFTVTENDVAKVTENRITSVYIHPSEEKLIVAAGDKQGYFGLWDVDADTSMSSTAISGAYGDKYASACGVDGIYKYRPHVSSICHIYSHAHTPSFIHTVSYDGTVRGLDLNAQAFISRFEAPESQDDMWFTDACEFQEPSTNPFSSSSSGSGSAATSSSENMLFVSRSDGFVSLIDFRKGSKGSSGYAWSADMGYKVQSVQHWPTSSNHILTANAGKGTSAGDYAGLIRVWDIRMMIKSNSNSSANQSKAICSFSGHTKSINAAYASPDGEYVVSVSQDNTIRCWQGDFLNSSSSKPGKSEISFTSRPHDNHTGRWLSTFRPTFDPKSPHLMILGSMARPRCLEVFAVQAPTSRVKAVLNAPLSLQSDQLNSVVSRNAAHRSLDVIAAANSSGRVHIFRNSRAERSTKRLKR